MRIKDEGMVGTPSEANMPSETGTPSEADMPFEAGTPSSEAGNRPSGVDIPFEAGNPSADIPSVGSPSLVGIPWVECGENPRADGDNGSGSGNGWDRSGRKVSNRETWKVPPYYCCETSEKSETENEIATAAEKKIPLA